MKILLLYITTTVKTWMSAVLGSLKMSVFLVCGRWEWAGFNPFGIQCESLEQPTWVEHREQTWTWLLPVHVRSTGPSFTSSSEQHLNESHEQSHTLAHSKHEHTHQQSPYGVASHSVYCVLDSIPVAPELPLARICTFHKSLVHPEASWLTSGAASVWLDPSSVQKRLPWTHRSLDDTEVCSWTVNSCVLGSGSILCL